MCRMSKDVAGDGDVGGVVNGEGRRGGIANSLRVSIRRTNKEHEEGRNERKWISTHRSSARFITRVARLAP